MTARAFINFTGFVQKNDKGTLTAQFAINNIKDFPRQRISDIEVILCRCVNYFDRQELALLATRSPKWENTPFDNCSINELRNIDVNLNETDVLRAIKAIDEYKP